MKTNSQNKFYTSISKYYSEIFPYNSMQLQFVKNRVGELTGKQILDIGCATGELAYKMAENGAKVTGIDLNEDLLAQAVRTSGFQSAVSKNRESEFAAPQIKFQFGNMLELKNDFQKDNFDAVLCFGNTLVHLESFDSIQQMINGVFTVLKPGGQFLLQILNYDLILKEKIAELPLIETENIRFVRKYHFLENSPVILFQTELYLKQDNITISNETRLFALKSAELIELLENSGFKSIHLFSNFKQDSFGGKHVPLVAVGKKI